VKSPLGLSIASYRKLNLRHEQYYSAGAIVILAKRTNMAVALFMALFVILTFISAGQVFAADLHSKPTPAAPSFGQGSDGDKDEDDSEEAIHHDKLRQQYGEVEQVFLPPLVVTDPSGIAGKGSPARPPAGAQIAPNGELLGSANIDPQLNVPLDPNSISKDKQSPADSFFQLATVAISTMAAGSIALGGFALRRTVKLRKNPNADFIYK